jgi:rhodanese-related sulfurtransferase
MPTIEMITADIAHDLIIRNTGNPDFVILDLRTPADYGKGHIAGAINIHSRSVPERMDSLDTSRTYLIYCARGIRSARIRKMMANAGFDRVYDLVGGYTGWTGAGY